MTTKEFRVGLTYDDVLLVPKLSPVLSRKDVTLRTLFSRRIVLNNPIVSSNMDTVTEAEMAIAIAQNGGIGVIHRFLAAEEQAAMIRRVKRAESYRIEHPYTCLPDTTVDVLQLQVARTGVRSTLVVDAESHLLGIVTNRDKRWVDGDKEARALRVSDIMTPFERLVVAGPDVTTEEAAQLLKNARVEKLPLVDEQRKVCGLITAKDLLNHTHRPYASLDAKGRLLVAAAIGVREDDVDRAALLVAAGVDALVIDVAHGHSTICIDQVKRIKAKFPETDIVAGNVATAQGVIDLAAAGADAIKVGVGPGSICTTRIVTGCGVPQLTAVMDAVAAAKPLKIPIIADGGIRTSGDIVKALATGASTVMLGSALAGTDEAPGNVLVKDGKKVKVVRGMAGFGATISRREHQVQGGPGAAPDKRGDVFDTVPEGVEAVVPYRGPVAGILHQLIGGICSGISYCGARTIPEMVVNAEFIRITDAGRRESGHHDVTVI